MATVADMFNVADKTAPGHYGPSQTALLLLDFHTMLVDKAGGPHAPAALNAAAKMRTWANSNGIQVVHGLIDLDDMPFPTCKDHDRFVGVIKALKRSGGEEHAALLKGDGQDVTYTRKPGYVSALRSPGLDDFLHKNGIKSLILTGLSTSACVMRTAVAASDAEYVVTVISDGCADPNDGEHDFMVEHVFNQRGYVTTAAEFQEGFAKAALGK